MATAAAAAVDLFVITARAALGFIHIFKSSDTVPELKITRRHFGPKSLTFESQSETLNRRRWRFDETTVHRQRRMNL